MEIDTKRTIYTESCFETFKKLQDKYIDVVFTSPPYNRKRNDKYLLYDDRIEDYSKFLITIIKESIRVSSYFAAVNLQMNHYNRKEVLGVIGWFSDKITETIIWEKSNPMPARGLAVTNAYEIILIFSKERIKANKPYTKNHITTSVNSKMPKNHKAVMHIDLAYWFINSFVKKWQTVYDPFLGVGTTGAACNMNGINWFGSEIIGEYAWNAHTLTGATLKGIK